MGMSIFSLRFDGSRRIIFASGVFCVSFLLVAGSTVPSVYDEKTDTWIGDLTALTNAIMNVAQNETIALGAGESAKFTAKGEHPLTPRKLCDSVRSFRSAGKMEGARLVCFRQRPAGGLRPSLALQAFEKFCRHADKLFARQFLREKFRLPARRFKPEKFLADDRSVFGLELLGKGLRRIKGL